MKKLWLLGICTLFFTGMIHADLVTHLAFDGDLTDSGPGGNDGTIVGGDGSLITFVEGVDGTPASAVSFASPTEGSTEGRDFISLAHNSGLPISEEPAYTIAMWVKGPIQKDNRIFSESDIGGNNTPLFNLGTDNNGNNAQFDFFYRPNSGTQVNHRHSSRDAFDDTWHHIAWVADNGQVTLYIDGIPDTVNFSYTPETLTGTATTIAGIMRGSACCQYTGVIDEVYLYNNTLTQEEVQALMGAAAFCPPEGDPDFEDTHVTDIQVDGPPNDLPGWYTITAIASDDTADEIMYLIMVDNGEGEPTQYGPGTSNTVDLLMKPGTWTVTVTVDDDFRCFDAAADAIMQTEIVVDDTPQLISHWTLDGDLIDTGDAQAGNDGTFVGDTAPAFTEGFDGTPNGAIQLDGVDDYIDVLQNGGLPIYTSSYAYTICLWVKGPGQSDRRVFAEASLTSTNPLFNIGCNTPEAGNAKMYIRGSHTYSKDTSQVAFDDTWHHIAWVDAGGEAVMYIDGIRDPQDFTYTHPGMTVHTTTIGGILRGTGPSHFFEGAIDDVRIYNYALTQEEILETFPEPAGCPDDGDTHCNSLTIEGPEGQTEGVYTAVCDATDDSGDPVFFIFTLTDEEGSFVQQIGPQQENTADFTLYPGDWTISVVADDAVFCRDQAADGVCTETVTVYTESPTMIAYYPFDGTVDDVEAGNHGEVVFYDDADENGEFDRNVVTPVFDRGLDCSAQSALLLDGASFLDAGYAGDTALPLNNRSTFSIAMWIKGPVQRDNRIFSESMSTSDASLFNIGTHYQGSGGQIDIYIRGDDGSAIVEHTLSEGIALDETWHHITWTDDDGEAVLYIDGVADATDFSYTRGTLTLDTTTIGGILRKVRLPDRNPGCCMFQGAIDDVRMYNYILSGEEIATLYGDGPPHCCPFADDPDSGDTHCEGLSYEGGPAAGLYTITCTASDDTGDPISYTFSAESSHGTVLAPVSQTDNTAQFELTKEIWTISATVDDDPLCDDAAADASCSIELEVGVPFLRGRVNNDADVDIADVVFLLYYYFLDGPEPQCMDAADANDDESVDLADAVALLTYLFDNAGPLPAPFAECGTDPIIEDDVIDCEQFPLCE